MERRRIIYYSDERNDEFSAFQTTPPKIDGSYDYARLGFGKRLARFFLYRVVMYPVVFFYGRFVFRQKIVGKRCLRPYRRQGCFLYGNHTQPLGDALLQTRLPWPRSTYVLVNPANLKVPVLGRWVPALGGLPLPDGVAAYRNFKAALERRVAQGHPVVVYPEAHIWPYYTKIRPFPDGSFTYPVQLGVPAFCFVNTYRKSRFRKRPRMVTYLDGPFFAPEEGDLRSRRAALRDAVYERMTELAAHSDTEYIQYIKRENPNG